MFETHVIFNSFIIKNTICETDDTIIQSCEINKKMYILKTIKIDIVYGIHQKVLRELSVLKKTKCKYIVKLHDVIYHDGNIIFVLEYGNNDLLHDEDINNNKTKIFYDVLHGLKYLNDVGYIHGDLSFKNIVKFNKTYKLIDFGSSVRTYRNKCVSQPTIYVSPIEFFNSANIVSEKIDSWSLGCLYLFLNKNDFMIIGNERNIISSLNKKIKNSVIMNLNY